MKRISRIVLMTLFSLIVLGTTRLFAGGGNDNNQGSNNSGSNNSGSGGGIFTWIGDVISDTATTYDATSTWNASQTPTKGEAQWTGRASGYDSSDHAIWQKVATTTFDTLGRPLLIKDINDAQVVSVTAPAGSA